ncbi:MAG: hypothetical protein C0624_02440 [Desulfuromonas sp.]|nr:MAG: hypothetical protein C0624_02440 [Desulfuromonas sp.]
MKRFLNVVAAIAAILLLLESNAWSNTIVAPVKLMAPDSEQADYFGTSVDISGDTAVVGADGDDDNGYNAGAAYVYIRQADGSWLEHAKLLAADGSDGDHFGWSVAISGDTLIIGAYGDDDNGFSSGSAYVFARQPAGSWTETAKLTAADGAGSDFFGFAVDLSGDTAVIGAYGDDDKGLWSGSAYIFSRQPEGTWAEEAKLLAPGGFGSDYFGFSVSISGDRAAIGSFGDDDLGYNSGSSHIFSRQTYGSWIEEAKLLALDGTADDYFGYAIDIDGDTAVIGGLGDGANGFRSGSAYVFTRQADGLWLGQAKLLAPDGAANDYFSISVAISGDMAVIGSYQDNDNGFSSGSAYLFSRGTNGYWNQPVKLLSPDGAEYDYFGVSVAIFDNTVLIGAEGKEFNGTATGSAYIGFDGDQDGIVDVTQDLQLADNCPTVWNPDQTDNNNDGFGDACVSASTSIGPDSTIGKFCTIGSNTTIDSGVTLGDYCNIGDHVSISRNVSAETGLTVGDYTTIERDVVLGRDVMIGKNVTMARNVQIGNHVTLGNDTSVDQEVNLGDYILGGTDVLIGQRATVTSGASLELPAVIPSYTVILKATSYP